MKKFLRIFLKIIVFFLGWIVLSVIIEIPDGPPAVWRFSAELIPLTVIILFTVLFLKFDQRLIQIPHKQVMLRGSLLGTIVGIFWIGSIVGILLLTGTIVNFINNQVSFLWLWILSAFINVVMQELLVRGYIYHLLKDTYNLLVAVIVTTMIFTLLHGGAFEAGIVPVINVITMCLFTSALYESEETLLAPIMAHAVWNIIGSLILGGVNLAEDYPNLYSMILSGNTLLSGGEYKIEGSVLVAGINILLILFFYDRSRRKLNLI
ncbi:CPBP family intramembrane glutamic endopeptidase [Hutsoniella sourekii]|uniref:CPBP family intramembrane glutamic endopeptidase n=1 Tax=Hutsoniella sourekii TaxID=87650 RepID=UPI000486926E|nr:type II CAAX endopeptidase family protein [Hutsoniella sourekii]